MVPAWCCCNIHAHVPDVDLYLYIHIFEHAHICVYRAICMMYMCMYCHESLVRREAGYSVASYDLDYGKEMDFLSSPGFALLDII